ncbi:hypothetical protein NM208_g1501 [Fusarium decemcellulare]|uniref:Uncharacterized protein n=1 Tax=Fusarium decemcellulare TaxID=57161 RepID=A0ACC1SVZ2_9HYPO|nr:hypothetical protein NM208_g1501 [Fusarium decemcellulare]
MPTAPGRPNPKILHNVLETAPAELPSNQRWRALVSAPGGQDKTALEPQLPLSHPDETSYHGIPASLVSTLVEEYFDNVYQSDLLLHKPLFLESLAAGTVQPHVLLSICAWGANFYRDKDGKAILKDQGYMLQWAKQAGKMVFQDIGNLQEDNIVTFCNLSLFWHIQGSWRISYLHKGNACQLLHIIGLGPQRSPHTETLGSEIRRRRLWACYLMHCFSSERLFQFDAIADIRNLGLPWPDDEFQAGFPSSPPVPLNSEGICGGIFAELIRGLTLWCSVVSVVKSTESGLDGKIRDILTLENEISA